MFPAGVVLTLVGVAVLSAHEMRPAGGRGRLLSRFRVAAHAALFVQVLTSSFSS
jgi:hypothetical protein